ncbi:hypothetical protein BC940DRAFT_343536 [Gongronella butleri]|nr:hypothetical protein BC940DRAFT_343536 [Gongronella butleri]
MTHLPPTLSNRPLGTRDAKGRRLSLETHDPPRYASSRTSSHPTTTPHSPLSPLAAVPSRPNSTPLCHSTSVDYNLLFDAMDDDGVDDRPQQIPKMAAAMPNSSSGANAAPPPLATHDSLDSMLSFLQRNDELLVQQMDDIEQLEQLVFLRVLYVGAASNDEKRLFLKKLSDGLSGSLFRHQLARTVASTHDFREKKHHLLPLSLFPLLDDVLAPPPGPSTSSNHPYTHDTTATSRDMTHLDDNMTLFEDNGVAIVEADFTCMDQPEPSTDTILRYVYTQFESMVPADQLRETLQLPKNEEERPFQGYVYPDTSPNGIDLCVYFYHDALSLNHRVPRQMDLLWKLSALGIPILPILSTAEANHASSPATRLPQPVWSPHSPSSTGTGGISAAAGASSATKAPLMPPSPASLYDEHMDRTVTTATSRQTATPRTLDQRRNELALFFSQWRVKMIDISNLNISDQPSFQSRGPGRPMSAQDTLMEKRLGERWAISSLVPPTPYHILSLFQFVNIDRWVISKLLRNIHDQQQKNQRVQQQLHGQQKNANGDENSPLHTDRPLWTSRLAKPTVSPSALHTSSSSLSDPESSSLDNAPAASSSSSSDSSASSASFTRPNAAETPMLLSLSSSSTYQLMINKLNSMIEHVGQPNLFTKQAKASPSALRSHVAYAGAAFALFYILWCLFCLVFIPMASWHASLIILNHDASSHSVSLMVSTYNGRDQPQWAPTPPLISTNLPLGSLANAPMSGVLQQHPSAASAWHANPRIPGDYLLSPLANRSSTMHGHYHYEVPLPPCSAMDPALDYSVRIHPSPYITHKRIQGSPYHFPKDLLCPQDSRFLSNSAGRRYSSKLKSFWTSALTHIDIYGYHARDTFMIIFSELFDD